MVIFDEEVGKVDAKKSLFRIYRDPRFSKDKHPIKPIWGKLGMGKEVRKRAVLLHLNLGNLFLGGGNYMPESSVLKRQ